MYLSGSTISFDDMNIENDMWNQLGVTVIPTTLEMEPVERHILSLIFRQKQNLEKEAFNWLSTSSKKTFDAIAEAKAFIVLLLHAFTTRDRFARVAIALSAKNAEMKTYLLAFRAPKSNSAVFRNNALLLRRQFRADLSEIIRTLIMIYGTEQTSTSQYSNNDFKAYLQTQYEQLADTTDEEKDIVVEECNFEVSGND
jgi:hypothetical protein